MTTDADPGLNVLATRERLVQWFLSLRKWPVDARMLPPPPRTHEGVTRLAWMHWCEHGVPVLVDRCGSLLPAPLCRQLECRPLGVALAIIEIDRSDAALKERDDIAWLCEASERARLSQTERETLLALGREIQLNPICRIFDNETGGRPTRVLAHAIAQHLKCAGFTYAEIGRLMNTKSE